MVLPLLSQHWRVLSHGGGVVVQHCGCGCSVCPEGHVVMVLPPLSQHWRVLSHGGGVVVVQHCGYGCSVCHEGHVVMVLPLLSQQVLSGHPGGVGGVVPSGQYLVMLRQTSGLPLLIARRTASPDT